MKVLLNVYGEITADVSAFYRLSKAEYRIAKTMLSAIESIKKVIESEPGTITLYFEKNKYWCETDGYSTDNAETISNSLNGAVVFEFGEYINSISYYNNSVSLYVVGPMYIEVFYDSDRNLIRQIRILEENHSRLSLYLDRVDISNLNT